MTLWPAAFGAACAVQLAYWLALRHGFRRARHASAPPSETPHPPSPISVIVAARDEAARLPDLLGALVRQTHPHVEIVIVDDASIDGTAAVVQAWQAEHEAIRLVRIGVPEAPRKKHALAAGIAAARHALLAFTDADCTPPPDWLTALAEQHAATPDDSVLVGYSPFRRAPGWLGRLARYETFVTGFLTAAAVGLGRPYMAVGRNLSYRRRTFEGIGGFGHSLHILSGDDDLFVQEVARRRAATVRAVLDGRTFVPTEAPATWRAWLRQKRRHASAGRFYGRAIQLHLALFQATSVALWAAPFVLGWAGLGFLGLRLLTQVVVLREAAGVLRERDLLPALPFLDLGYAAYNLFLAPLGLARPPKRW